MIFFISGRLFGVSLGSIEVDDSYFAGVLNE
jgi:hypothetical protein